VSAIAEVRLLLIEGWHRLRTPGRSRVAGRWFRGEYVDGDGPRKLWDQCRCPRLAARCPLSPQFPDGSVRGRRLALRICTRCTSWRSGPRPARPQHQGMRESMAGLDSRDVSARPSKIAVDAGSRQLVDAPLPPTHWPGCGCAAEAWSWAAVVIAPIRDDRVVAAGGSPMDSPSGHRPFGGRSAISRRSARGSVDFGITTDRASRAGDGASRGLAPSLGSNPSLTMAGVDQQHEADDGTAELQEPSQLRIHRSLLSV
jgi:hypothetical protein